VAVTSYHTVNSQILGESTSATRVDYLADALGSVTATTNSSGVVQNRYRYKPYGSRLSKTGSAADPKYLWLGCWGYRSHDSSSAVYVRRRHYDRLTARWPIRDPKFRKVSNRYLYSLSNPIRYVDPSGLQSREDNIYCKGVSENLDPQGKPISDKRYILDGWNRVCNAPNASFDALEACLRQYCPSYFDCIPRICDGLLNVKISCIGAFGFGDCEDYDSSDCSLHNSNTGLITLCGSSLPSKRVGNPTGDCREIECVLLHEFLHRCGADHDPEAEGFDPVKTCKCFNCIRELFPRCDGYYTYNGKRYKFDECNKIGASCR
jgi:RHS repeat-associated protein